MRDIKWNADRQTDGQTAFHSYNIDYQILSGSHAKRNLSELQILL